MEHFLNAIGSFSNNDINVFKEYTTIRTFDKNELLLKHGEICKSVFYILSGSFYQFQTNEIDEIVIDLHLKNEWLFNHTSLISQAPSITSIKAFAKAEVVELPLTRLHDLISKSSSYLQLGRLFNQAADRIYFFDNCLTPAQKYGHLMAAKPLAMLTFPVKMIASYLKIAPETLSRVRARC